VALKRGVVEPDGTLLTISTSKFFLGRQEYGKFQAGFKDVKVRASLFPEDRITLAGDETWEEVLTAFCSAYGKTAVFDVPAAAHWGYQFLPDGKQVILNNAMQFLNLIRQKYFVFAADLGDEEVLFYHGMANRDADYQYTLRHSTKSDATDIVTGNIFFLEAQPLDQCTYMARDEAMSLRFGGTANKPLHNMGYLESTDAFPAKSTQPLLVRAPMRINFYPLNGDIVRLDTGWYTNARAYPIEVIEELKPGKSGFAWQTTVQTTRVFENTAGGALPSTIERVSSYTPLVTSGFDGVLDENDNNLQAAMETLDDHTHGLPVIAAGTYTPTLYNVTNVAASGLNADFFYLRVGAVVVVSGSVTVDPTAALSTTLGISLPIASAFDSSYDLNGNATNPGATAQLGSMIADTTNDRASLVFTALSVANAFWRLVFVYRVK